MPKAPIARAGNTRFGRLDAPGPLALMAQAAQAALDDARLERCDVDGVLCGYATTLPHLMLSPLFCERFALSPACAYSIQLGGATGGALLVAARDGGSVPSYYALMASRYLHESGLTEADLAAFAVLMRRHAATHPDAHLREPITQEQVLASKPVSSPLKLLDCCPISDGACALVVTSRAGAGTVEMLGAGQAHRHQHLSAWPDVQRSGAGDAAARALEDANCRPQDIDLLAIYDSFTITLAMLLEEIGFAPRGGSAHRLREGAYALDGRLPLNPHGGLLSFGHCGVGGGMAHAVEAYRQLAGKAGDRQLRRASRAFVHADGGVMSSHVSLVLGGRS